MRSRERGTSSDAIGHGLERIHLEGRRAHGDLGVDGQAFRRALERRFAARFAALGVDRGAPEAADLLARADARGLYLAVACDAGGIPEIIEDGVTGWLVPPRDPARLARAVLAALGDRETARRTAAAGREKVLRGFTADAMVEGTLRVYRELLKDSGRQAA